MVNTDYEKTGYLNEPFKLFHLTDHEMKNYECHYHDFYKIMFFLSGDVDYFIEGITYRLEPSDIVLIAAGEVHRPVIRSTAPYERITGTFNFLYLGRFFLGNLFPETVGKHRALPGAAYFFFFCSQTVQAL